MRIGIVYHGPYPYNRGIDQLATGILGIGHKPEILCRSNSHYGHLDRFGGAQLHYVTNGMKFYHFPFNPWWRNIIIKIARNRRWKTIIVRETLLSWPVLSAAIKLGIPAMIDMRENLSAMYSIGQAKNIFQSLLRSKALVQKYERIMVPRFDHVFTVSKELREWAMSSLKLDNNKISVLSNFPSHEFMNLAEQALAQINRPKNIIRLVYAGNIKESKGIGSIVKAMPILLLKQPCVRLRIIGEGPYLPKLKKIAKTLDINWALEYFPMLNMKELTHALAECHVGIEACPPGELTNQTLPGKLFEYMALGLAIISSARRSVERVMLDAKCGNIFNDSTPRKISDIILNIISDPVELETKGFRGREAILSRYNWRVSQQTLDAVFCSSHMAKISKTQNH